MRMRMMATLLLAGLLLAFSKPKAVSAADWEFSPTRPELMQRMGVDAGSDLDAKSDSTTAAPGKKNVGRALLFSVLLPGTGQLYAGPWWRALPWLAVEAAGWGVFAVYQKKGNDKTNEFQDFANAHFDTARYWAQVRWILENNNNKLPDNFTHELPSERNQQYYEMIGKYIEQFGFGWDDAVDLPPEDPRSTLSFDGTTANFFYYAGMRGDANDLYHTANIGMEVVLVNHILSPLEAAFLVRSHNRKVDKQAGLGHLQYERKMINGADTRMLTLRIPIY
jgi:hypothetical protein